MEKKIPIADIAKTRGLAEDTIVSHIEKMSASGQNLDIEYLKPQPEIFDEIKTAFEKRGTETLSPVYEYLNGKYDYDIIRLVRIFL